MVLQGQRTFFRQLFIVLGEDAVAGRAEDRLVVLNQDAVLKDRLAGGADQMMVRVPAGGFKNDIIGLPFAWGPANVGQRRRLPVNRAALAVRISGVVVTVEHLQFVNALHENAAVAALLAVAFGRRFGPFNMQLEVGELILGVDAAGAGFAFHIIVFLFPFDRSFVTFPMGKIRAIKEHNGVRGRRGQIAEFGGGRHHRGHGTIWVMHMPFAGRQQRSIGITRLVFSQGGGNPTGQTGKDDGANDEELFMHATY